MSDQSTNQTTGVQNPSSPTTAPQSSPRSEPAASATERESLWTNAQIRFFNQAGLDGTKAQAVLRQKRGLVVGGGVVAADTLSLLADAGLGALDILDGRGVEHWEVTGHPLFVREDIGKSRGEAIQCHLLRRHPSLPTDALQLDPFDSAALPDALKTYDFALVCLDSPNPALLEAVNEAALQTGVRWIAGQIYLGAGIVGPTTIPHESPCYQCYQLRRNANLVNYEETLAYEARLRQLPVTRDECAAPRPLAALVGSLLATEALRLASGLSFPQTIGRILRVDFFAPEITHHRFLRMPFCPACGYGRRSGLPVRR